MTFSLLVVPGSGAQGRAVVKTLTSANLKVSFLVRNVESTTAQALSKLGATAIAGDLGDQTSLETAMAGVDGVFFTAPAHPLDELRFASNVISAARKSSVKHFIYTSVARTGEHESFPNWNKDDPMAWYWLNKDTIEKQVRDAGFENWTILKPAYFMQNFEFPLCNVYFPGLADKNELCAPFNVDTKLHVVDTNTISRAALEAFQKPGLYHGQSIALADEALTLTELAASLSQVSGKTIVPKHIGDDGLDAMKGWLALDTYIWIRDFGYSVDIDALAKYSLELTTTTDVWTRDGLGF